MTPAIELNEIVTAVRFPLWPAGHELRRSSSSRAATAISPSCRRRRCSRSTRRQDHARVGDDRRRRGRRRCAPREVEQAITGQAPSDELFREACESCRKLEAIDDIHAPASYRQHLAAVLSRRALEKAHARLTAPMPAHGRIRARPWARSARSR